MDKACTRGAGRTVVSQGLARVFCAKWCPEGLVGLAAATPGILRDPPELQRCSPDPQGVHNDSTCLKAVDDAS